MMLLTSVVANIKNGVCESDLGLIQIFEGPNGSGKSARLQAIDLLVNGTSADVRGKDRKAANAILPLRTRSIDDHDAIGSIIIDGVISDNGVDAPVSAVAGSGRTVRSWPIDSTDEFTDGWRLAYPFIVGDDSLGWLKLMAKVGARDWREAIIEELPEKERDEFSRFDADVAFADFNHPGLQVFIQAFEASEAALKALKDSAKALKEEREVLRRHRDFDAVNTIDKQLDKDSTVLKERVAEHALLEARLALLAQTTARCFDQLAAATFGSLTDRFGRPTLALPGCAAPYPCLVDSAGLTKSALSGAEEVFVALWIANGLVSLNQFWRQERGMASTYACFIMPDRSFDSDFYRRLRDDVSRDAGAVKLQIFGVRSVFK